MFESDWSETLPLPFRVRPVPADRDRLPFWTLTPSTPSEADPLIPVADTEADTVNVAPPARDALAPKFGPAAVVGNFSSVVAGSFVAALTWSVLPFASVRVITPPVSARDHRAADPGRGQRVVEVV